MTTDAQDARRLLAVLVVAGALLTACDTGEPSAGHAHRQAHHPVVRRGPSPHPTPHPSRRSHSPTTSPVNVPVAVPTAAAIARADLDRLVVRPRPVGTEGYVRDAFGSDWVDTDHDGCNQRDDVLLRDAVPGTTKVQQQGSCDHDVLAGTWHDPYTGRTLHFTDLKDLSQAEAIQIDHVVPLAEAWVSGARSWSRDRREVFANDLGELLAVDGPTNMSKGDGDPAAWRPRQGYQCAYARRWIAVKLRYALAVDTSEKSALTQMLGYCR
jgi:uncharacterized protein DUF1524